MRKFCYFVMQFLALFWIYFGQLDIFGKFKTTLVNNFPLFAIFSSVHACIFPLPCKSFVEMTFEARRIGIGSGKIKYPLIPIELRFLVSFSLFFEKAEVMFLQNLGRMRVITNTLHVFLSFSFFLIPV